jgi:pentatricopeptide repeat protein
MVNSYGLNGMGIQAVELFRQVRLDMLNEWIYVCVLNACSHSGLIQEAREIFNEIPIDEKTNKIYATMVNHYRFLLRSNLFVFRSMHLVVAFFSMKHKN